MGSQPIRIQLGKILRENLPGNSSRKILRENLVGKSCGKSYRKILQENLAGNVFAMFRLLTGNKTSPFFSCRGGSKLQFGGSYVKIGQELASEMHFLSR